MMLFQLPSAFSVETVNCSQTIDCHHCSCTDYVGGLALCAEATDDLRRSIGCPAAKAQGCLWDSLHSACVAKTPCASRHTKGDCECPYMDCGFPAADDICLWVESQGSCIDATFGWDCGGATVNATECAANPLPCQYIDVCEKYCMRGTCDDPSCGSTFPPENNECCSTHKSCEDTPQRKGC